MFPIDVHGVCLTPNSVIDTIDVGEDEVLLLEVRTQVQKNKSSFPL